MESKYYTPRLSEFHETFQYEHKTKNGSWCKELFHLSESHINIIKYVNIQDNGNNEHQVRVKCLDKLDILLLGWVFRKGFPNDLYTISPSYLLQLKDGIATIVNDFRLKRPLTDYESKPSIQLFHGEIKNASELKKLMNQLNILV